MCSVAGDPHAHQNPGLLALSVVWLRYHNAMAARMQAEHPSWTDEKLFHAARRRVIAILQVLYAFVLAILLICKSIGSVCPSAACQKGVVTYNKSSVLLYQTGWSTKPKITS